MRGAGYTAIGAGRPSPSPAAGEKCRQIHDGGKVGAGRPSPSPVAAQPTVSAALPGAGTRRSAAEAESEPGSPGAGRAVAAGSQVPRAVIMLPLRASAPEPAYERRYAASHGRTLYANTSVSVLLPDAYAA